MLGDMFETAEDLLGGNPTSQILSVSQRRPKNCAGLLELPPLSKETQGFMGLQNQGATCYLNSLIQSLFMQPEFRDAIFKFPLGENGLKFVDSQQKLRLLQGFQRMFAQMQALDLRVTNTEELTASFGWEAKESFQQQDIQEANRVIFDVLERALFGTSLTINPTALYKGTLVNHITCTSCMVPREREENFFDLMLQVNGFNSIEESLMGLITPEMLDESNQLYCDFCQKKSDTLKGVKIRKFPDVLTISLNRFTFDYEKLDRVKLNTKFEFGLELNIAPYIDGIEEDDASDNLNYELHTVLIHRGSAHGGHYHTYIRDYLGEGNWDQKMKEYHSNKEKKLQEKAKEEEQKLALQKEKEDKQEKIKQEKKLIDEKIVVRQEDGQEIIEYPKDQSEDNNKKEGKNKKNKQKEQKQQKGKGKNNEQKENTTNNSKQSSSKNAGKNNNTNDEYEFDEVEFMRECKNKDLMNNWYDFNDGIVSSIKSNRIQKQFGGSGNESAYILVYRKKTLSHAIPKPTIPEYLLTGINAQNKALEKQRSVYDDALQHIQLLLHSPSAIDISKNKLSEGYDLDKGMELRVRVDSPVKKVILQVAELKGMQVDELVLAEVIEHPNKYTQYLQILSISDELVDSGEATLQKLEISHLSSWICLNNLTDAGIIEEIKKHVGSESIPIRLNIHREGVQVVTVLAYANESLSSFRQNLLVVDNSIGYGEQYITNDQLVHINNTPEKDNLTFAALKIVDDSDLFLRKIDLASLPKNESENHIPGQKLSEYDEAILQGLVSVLVESGDEGTVKRFFIDYRKMNLQDLLEFVKDKFGIDKDSSRRLRNIEINQLYFKDEYTKNLEFLSFGEGGTRLSLERGEIPVSGNVPVKIKNQSKLITDPVKNNQIIEILIADDQTLAQLQRQLELTHDEKGLEPNEHKLYKTDWLEDPIQLIANETQLIRTLNFKKQEVLVLRDLQSPIDREFEKLSAFICKKGSSDENEYLGDLRIKRDQTIGDLKQLILAMPAFSEKAATIIASLSNPLNNSLLRLRDLRKDGLSGQIWRHEDKKIGQCQFATSNVTIQILDSPEELSDDQLVLVIKQRNQATRTYNPGQEIVFKAGNKPTISQLKTAVAESIKEDNADNLIIVKYFPYEFAWREIVNEIPAKNNNSSSNNANKAKNNSKKNNENNSKKQQGKKNTTDNSVPTVIVTEASTETSEKSQAQKVTQDKSEEVNLKKAPYLLKDGDIIGYAIKKKDTTEGEDKLDDFQTEQDASMKKWFEEEKRLKRNGAASTGSKHHNDALGFKINLDF